MAVNGEIVISSTTNHRGLKMNHYRLAEKFGISAEDRRVSAQVAAIAIDSITAKWRITHAPVFFA
jgi:hypothetical protein